MPPHPDMLFFFLMNQRVGEMARGLRALLCSQRPGLNSQHPGGDLQPSVTPVPGTGRPLLISTALHTCGTLTCMEAKHPYI